MSYDYNLTDTKFRGFCSIIPDGFMSDFSDTSSQDMITGAWASARDAEKSLTFIKNTVENNSDLSISQATGMMREYAYTNVLSGKNILSILEAIDDLNDLQLPCYHYSSHSADGYKKLGALAYVILPYFGLYNAYGNTHQEASEHTGYFNDDITLCYYNGRPVKIKMELMKPTNCYVTRSIDDQYEMGGWVDDGLAKRGTCNLTLYNLSIGFSFTVKPNDDPDYADMHDKLNWKPLKSTIAIDPSSFYITYTRDSDNDNVTCFAIDSTDNPSYFVTIDSVQEEIATSSGFYTSICDVVDAALASPVSLPIVSIYNKLGDYVNSKVDQFKDRFMGYEYMPLRSVLATVCSTLQDTYSETSGSGYSTLSDNPNFISNVIQITTEVIISIVLTVLSLVLTIVSRVLGVIMMVISSIISTIRENTHLVTAEVDHTAEMPVFNVATPAKPFAILHNDLARGILSEANVREFNDRLLNCGVASLGMLTPNAQFDFDTGFYFNESPSTRSRIIDLMYSNGFDLQEQGRGESGSDKQVQFAFTPSRDGGIYMPASFHNNGQVSFVQTSGAGVIASKLNQTGEVTMEIPKSTSSAAEWYAYNRPHVNYSDTSLYQFDDARLAYEFGMGVAEWIVRCYLVSNSAYVISKDYMGNVLSPAVTDGTNFITSVGIPSYEQNALHTPDSTSKWRYDNSYTEISNGVYNATGQFNTWLGNINKDAYVAYLCAMSYILFHYNTESKLAVWDDVIALFNLAKPVFNYPHYNEDLFRQMLREGGLWACPCSGYEALDPCFLLPNISKKGLILSLVATGVIVVAVTVATIVAKRALKKAAVKSWHRNQQKYNDAVTAYNSDQSSGNLKALYKANKKLGRSGKFCALTGVKSVGGWDPTGFYTHSDPVPTQESQMPLTEYLMGPYATQLSENLADMTTQSFSNTDSTIIRLITGETPNI